MNILQNKKQLIMWIITGVMALFFLTAGLYLRGSGGSSTQKVQSPVLILNAKNVQLETGDKFDALSYVKKAEGTDGSDLTKDVKVPTIPTDVPGEYDVVYTYTGTDPKNTASATLHVTVTEKGKNADSAKASAESTGGADAEAEGGEK